MKKDCSLNSEDLLKIIAVISMIIDHTGLFFFSENVELRIIGRLAFPIFAFFMGRNLGRVRYDVLLAGIILQVLFYVAGNDYYEINILISFFLSSFLVMICKSWYGYIILAMANMISIFACIKIEYNLFPLMFMTLGYMTKRNQVQTYNEFKYRTFSSIAVLMYFIYTIMKFGFVMGVFDYLLLVVIVGLLWSFLFKDVSRDFRMDLFEYRSGLLGGGVVYGLRLISRHTLFIYVGHLFLFTEVLYRFA